MPIHKERKMMFKSISQEDLPSGRKGKHHAIIRQLLDEIEQLDDSRALQIPLAELPDTKANIRSALNRATRQRDLEIATSSDDEYFYVWKTPSKNGTGAY